MSRLMQIKGAGKEIVFAISEDIEVMFGIGRTSPITCTVYGAKNKERWEEGRIGKREKREQGRNFEERKGKEEGRRKVKRIERKTEREEGEKREGEKEEGTG